MDIDMSALRGLVREKEISFDLLVEAIESALLIAYHRTEGSRRHARVKLDRETGHVTVWAKEDPEDLDEGQEAREFDDTPSDFGRIAATTAKQVILQRLRDAEDDATLGEYAGREGDIVTGVVQQGRDPKNVLVDIGKLEAILPVQEQVPGETYPHGLRLRSYVVRVAKGVRGPSVTLSRTHPNLVEKLFALEVPEIADGSVEISAIAREAGHRTKIAVRSTRSGLNAKGANVMGELNGEKIDMVAVRRPGPDGGERAVPGPGDQGRGGGHGGPLRAGDRPRLPTVAGDRQGGPERPPRRPADRLADRHPPGHRADVRMTVRADGPCAVRPIGE
ncbi:Transcription termination/antitermination protein NusA [Streptomyces hirsutus]